MAYDDRHLAGIGGWLAFFWISVTFLAPLTIIGSTIVQFQGAAPLAQFYGSQWPFLQAGEWAIAGASLAGLWFMSWRLMKVETWQTVRIVIAGIWLVGIGGPLVEMLLVGSTGLVDAGKLGEVFGAELIRPLVADALWTAYFLKSRRVANTYVRDGDNEEVAEVFS